MKSIYFDELQKRVRDIRSSQRSAMAKITDVLAASIDYKQDELVPVIHRLRLILNMQQHVERFANFLLYTVEAWANGKSGVLRAWTINDVEQLAKQFVINFNINRDLFDESIYQYPSYNGVCCAREGEEPNSSVCLPQELQAYKKNYVVLRVQGMNRLIEHCSDPISGRPRPYDILAQLDHLIVDCLPEGVFPANPLITADVENALFDFSHFPFKFSHFEVDMQEPDPDFRTLYVVYSY